MCSDREAEPIALAYMAEGYQAFVMRYSVGDTTSFSEAFEDAVNALTYIRENAAELRVDADRIAVVGFSAGGHLAAAVATMAEEKPAAMILGYPVILASAGEMLRKEIPSLEEKVTKSTPPAFIFATSNDMLVPIENSLKLALALGQNKVPFELRIYGDGSHGLSLARTHTSDGRRDMVNETVAEWFGASAKWLKKTWGDFPAEESNELVMAGTFSLSIMNRFSPEVVTNEMLEEIKAEMEAIENPKG